MSNKKIIIGYTVKCDDELNPPDVVARNEFRAILTVHYTEDQSDDLTLTIENNDG